MIDLPIFSPVESLSDPLFSEKGVEVFIKRDDLIHPFISGNKWRKLKYVLKDAQSQDKSHLVTFGGAYSNHLLATACAAAKFGFRSTGYVRGEEVYNPHLQLCHLFGMELRFTDRSAYRDKPALFNQSFAKNTDAYFIDEGGAGRLAQKGCAELIPELNQPFDHLFCAAGTGTTAAGIVSGLLDQKLGTIVHVVPVLKGGGYLAGVIKSSSTGAIQLHEDYHFGGYAKTSPELLHFIHKFSSSTGILIDQVYTGKMMFALYDLLAKDHFPRGSKILALHTGGLLGILGLKV